MLEFMTFENILRMDDVFVCVGFFFHMKQILYKELLFKSVNEIMC